MGKLETLMFKLSIPMPRVRIALPDLADAKPPQDATAAGLAVALGSLAGKSFSSPPKALSWAKKKKLLPPDSQARLTWYEAAFMLFSFARATRQNIALPSLTRLFDVADVKTLPRWSLTAAQWCLSSGLVSDGDFAGEISHRQLSALFLRYVAALREARRQPQREYKLQLFGDSITDDTWGDCTTWVSFFPSRLEDGKPNVVNHAYGGGNLTAVPRKKNCVVRLLPKMLHPDNDLVVVFALTNDFAADTLGPGGPDSSDAQTIWGAVKALSQAVGPVPLLFVGPCPRCNAADAQRQTNPQGLPINSAGWSLAQGNEALRDAAVSCGCYYLDMYEAPVFHPEELEYATIDGLHPNALGDVLLAARIYRKIQEILGG